MTIQRIIELLEIEHECILRNSHGECDRNCADCDLVQDDGDLHEMYTDVIALAKEREPIPCGEKIKAGDVMLDFYECGHYKNAIRKPWKYCPFCGKEVKRDG